MKKLFFVVVLSLLTTVVAWSQEMSPHAIGLKSGGGVGNFVGLGADISYQRAMKSTNRLELNFGLTSKSSSYNLFRLQGFYQWVKPLQGGLNWYAGPGVGIGYAKANENDVKDQMLLGVGGQVGLEYRFNIPLQLTLDTTPYFGVLNSQGFAMPIQLGVRYMFK